MLTRFPPTGRRSALQGLSLPPVNMHGVLMLIVIMMREIVKVCQQALAHRMHAAIFDDVSKFDNTFPKKTKSCGELPGPETLGVLQSLDRSKGLCLPGCLESF